MKDLHVLEKVDESAGMFRRYEISVLENEVDLFGSAWVAIRYGRIGETLAEKKVSFGSIEQARAFCAEKVRSKSARGYRPVAYLENETPLEDNKCFFCRMLKHPHDDPCLVAQLPNSTLVIGWDQTYRGRSILVLNKHIPDFFRVSHQEMLGLLSDIKTSERAIRTVFCPDMMNYLFMGNVTRHAHLHLVPRYRDDPNFGSSPFLDTTRVKKPSLTDHEYRQLAIQLRRAIRGG